jgi:short-subunit dehydrogenase
MSVQQTIWITGASQGLGAALALEYTRQGYRVFASARNATALLELEKQTASYAGVLLPLPLDITDITAVAQAVSTITQQGTQPLEKAILNAGTHISQPIKDYNSQDLRTLVELNLMGTVYCIEALLPFMLPRHSGMIAIVASLAGYSGLPNASGYGATKAALINLAESLKLDLEQQGVDIRLINPGFIKTPLTDKNTFPMPSIITATQAANIIAKGLESKSFEIRFPTRFASVMALLKHLPYALYFPLVRRLTGIKHESQ